MLAKTRWGGKKIESETNDVVSAAVEQSYVILFVICCVAGEEVDVPRDKLLGSRIDFQIQRSAERGNDQDGNDNYSDYRKLTFTQNCAKCEILLSYILFGKLVALPWNMRLLGISIGPGENCECLLKLCVRQI